MHCFNMSLFNDCMIFHLVIYSQYIPQLLTHALQSISLLLSCKIIEIFEVMRDLGFIKSSLFTCADDYAALPFQNNISLQIMAQKTSDFDTKPLVFIIICVFLNKSVM